MRSSHDHHHEAPLSKAWEEVVDDELFEQIQTIASAYQNAIVSMSRAVREARRQLAGQIGFEALSPAVFEQVFREEVLNAIRGSLPDISDSLAAEVIRSGEAGYAALPDAISVRFRFDAKDPRAIAWAENRAGTMIVQIGEETLQKVREIIARSLTQGTGIPAAAREIERIVGLHARWQTAVDNFYEREFSRFSESMSLDDAINAAEKSALEYHDRLVAARAMNIARTEILAAQNIGQVLSWYQAAENGVLDLATAEKEWVAGPDGWKGIDVCDECMDLAGQRVPVTSVFTNGEFSPPLHPNCRCTMNLIPMVDVEAEIAALEVS